MTIGIMVNMWPVIPDSPIEDQVERLIRAVKGCVKEAYNYITILDGAIIGVAAGPHANKAFTILRTELSHDNFGTSSLEALKKATYRTSDYSFSDAKKASVRTSNYNDAPKRLRDNKCRKCGVTVQGSFKEHRNVCTSKINK